MNRTFDLVVVGTGEAGATAAHYCRANGADVAVVDSRDYGGTCALRGCDPKKVLVGVSESADLERRFEGKGQRNGRAEIDWNELIRFKRSFTEPYPAMSEEKFTKAGIATFHGTAVFTGPNTVRVGTDGLEAKNILIATGAWPAKLNIPGEENLCLSDRFMDLDTLPERVVFVGGGYIAFEFSHIASRAGARVTILHRGDRPLKTFDPDLVDRLVERTEGLGIDVRTGTAVTSVERNASGLTVNASSESGPLSFEADLVVHAAGRVPELGELNLAAAEVEYGKRGVKVNGFLQSVSNPAVYSAGDAADGGGLPSTPDAEYEGLLAARNITEGNRYGTDLRGPASVVFTVPPLASVGLSEEAARKAGLKFTVNHADIAGWYSSRRVNEPAAAFKVLLEEESDRILGAHLLGPGVDELANIFALAIRLNLSSRTLKEFRFLYPTQASNVKWML